MNDTDDVQEPQEGADGVSTPAPSDESTIGTDEGVINEQGDKAGEGTVTEHVEAGEVTDGLRTGIAEHDDVDPATPLDPPIEAESKMVSTYPNGAVPPEFLLGGYSNYTHAEPEGRIIREGEEVVFKGEVVGDMVVVTEDVYREIYPRRSKRPTHILLYRAGMTVPVSSLQAYGATVEASTEDDNEG